MSRVAPWRPIVAAAALALTLVLPAPARADFSFISSRSALGGNDSIKWGTLGPTGTVVTQFDSSLFPYPNGDYDPFSVHSSGGLNATVYMFANSFSNVGLPTNATIGTLLTMPSLNASGYAP